MVSLKKSFFTAVQAADYIDSGVVGRETAEIMDFQVDSRKCGKGSLFIALKGEKTDGHLFVEQAFDRGAAGALVSSARVKEFESLIGTESRFLIPTADPLQALQKIASGHMKALRGPVKIGVTGSSGKTTTKELIAAVLSKKHKVAKTEGNLNSEIGLPLSVLNIRDDHEYAVIEMGINRVGEMDVLAEILRPDIVVITNIGTAHIGIFKTIEKIASEKKRALSFFDGEGALFLDEDGSWNDFLSENAGGKVLLYGSRALEDSGYAVKAESIGIKGWKLNMDSEAGSVDIRLPLSGEHNLKNALCAICLGLYTGVSPTEMKEALESITSLPGRSQIIEGEVTIIQDCYNANADSILKSMKFADDLDWNGQKVYVFGDMKELGDLGAELHRVVGKEAALSRAGTVLFYGKDSREAYSAAFEYIENKKKTGPALFWTDDYRELESKLLKILQKGDLLLLKASRAMNLERLVEPVSSSGSGRGELC